MIFSSSFNNIYPNLPAYWALGDRAGSVTGLGGNVNDTRYFTRPTGYPPMVYSLATQEENFAPNGLSQWNPLLVGFDLTQGMSTDPALTQKGNAMAWNWGFQQGLVCRLSNVVSNLTSIESQISSVMKSDKLTDAQKSKLQAILDRIARLKEQINKAASSGNLKAEDVEAIQGQVKELIDKASKTAEGVMKEVQDSADSKEADDASGSDDDTETTPSGKVDPKTEVAKKQKELNTKAVDICQDIYTGTIGNSFRADYKKVNSGVSQINKENVASVLNTWDKQYAKNGKGLIETLFNQEWCWNDSLDKNAKPGEKIANPGNNNMNIIWNIVACLDQRAKELGIKEDLAGQFAVAYDELDDTFVDEKAVQDAVATIQKAISEKEAEKASEASDKEVAEKEKADKANKKNKAEEKEKTENTKKETEAKKLFLSDMREILKDDNAEVSDKVEYKDGEFVVRVEGQNYYGSTYKELAKALKEAGYKPEEYLKKKAVNTKA